MGVARNDKKHIESPEEREKERKNAKLPNTNFFFIFYSKIERKIKLRNIKWIIKNAYIVRI